MPVTKTETKRLVSKNEGVGHTFKKEETTSGVTPSIGRIVHYVNSLGEHQAAIVVKVNKSTVNLLVFTTTIESRDKVKHVDPTVINKEGQGEAPINTYHYPERV